MCIYYALRAHYTLQKHTWFYLKLQVTPFPHLNPGSLQANGYDWVAYTYQPLKLHLLDKIVIFA